MFLNLCKFEISPLFKQLFPKLGKCSSYFSFFKKIYFKKFKLFNKTVLKFSSVARSFNFSLLKSPHVNKRFQETYKSKILKFKKVEKIKILDHSCNYDMWALISKKSLISSKGLSNFNSVLKVRY